MKISVLSDSHGSYEKLEKIIDKEQPDSFVFCGDGIKDILKLCDRYPELDCHIVTGNCDYVDNFPLFKCIDVYGKRFYITHGHMECVKSGYMTLLMRAAEMESDIVLFGHTHMPVYTTHMNIYVMNPGSVSAGSYGILEIDDKGKVKGELKFL
ncbi:MAG: YfcE family phosphodiesterase [Clostridia bacterium]|nr:YfcE family phosphodiesterase [Clostridia bacterium]